MAWCAPSGDVQHVPNYTFYREALVILRAAQIPFLVGGAYALTHYTGIVRYTKDLDIFVQTEDYPRVARVLGAAGYRTELTFPHWLGKAFCEQECIDVIFNSGNGITAVDAGWFAHAVAGLVLDVPVQLCAPEEMLWSKSFIMERERYDGADIMHLLRSCSAHLDWSRLLARFGSYWRVLLSYLTLFGFVYPAEQSRIPPWVMHELLQRLQDELQAPSPAEKLCQGTLLSRAQYRVDLDDWGYQDARLLPRGRMTVTDIAQWTAAIAEEEKTV